MWPQNRLPLNWYRSIQPCDIEKIIRIHGPIKTNKRVAVIVVYRNKERMRRIGQIGPGEDGGIVHQGVCAVIRLVRKVPCGSSIKSKIDICIGVGVTKFV